MVSIFRGDDHHADQRAAAFALARMRFWGSATLATGRVSDLPDPGHVAVSAAVQDVRGIRRLTGIQLINDGMCC
jgi:hypothetical protein